MLLSWEIPNVAARIAGSSVSLNLAHAFEAGMAGYGLGRILNSRDSSDAQPAATPLGQNLEAGERAAAANSQTPTTKLPATVASPHGSTAPAVSNPNTTALAPKATQVQQNGNRPIQRY